MNTAAIFINLIALAGAAFLLNKKLSGIGGAILWPAIAARLLAGLVLGVMYSRYYSTGDTFSFFETALEQRELFLHDPGAYFSYLLPSADPEWKGAARSVFFEKIVSVFVVVANGNYWIASLWISFVSFLGAAYLYDTVTKNYTGSRLAAAIAFFFFPSVLFWGSGVIKESLALGGIMVLGALFIKIIKSAKVHWVEWLLGALCIWLVWNLKYYWMAIFLPVFFGGFVVETVSRKWKVVPMWRPHLYFMVILVFGVVASLLHPNFHLSRILQVIQESNAAFMASSAPEDVIHLDGVDGTLTGTLLSSGKALYSGLFRPFIWEAGGGPQIFAAIENIILLVLLVACLVRFPRNGEIDLAAMAIIFYSAYLCIFLALSTPNFGTLSRYRVGFLPFLIFLVAYKNVLLTGVSDKLFK